MTFFAKFRRVAKYGVAVFLPAAACFSAFADEEQTGIFYPIGDCKWEWNGTNGFNVTCSMSGSGFIPVEGANAGDCTNCTAMSPAECAQIKNFLLSQTENMQLKLNNASYIAANAQSELERLGQELAGLQSEGEQFQFFSGITHVPGDSQPERNEYLMGDQNAASPYLEGFGPESPSTHATYAMGGTSGIYNYYNQTVGPAIDDVQNTLRNMWADFYDQRDQLAEVSTGLYNIYQVANTMNCEACSSGGGGGGSSQPSSPSGGCPCSEAIYAVRDAVGNVEERLTEINNHLSTWNNSILKISSFIDYMKSAIATLSYMGTNFVFATQYRKLNDTTFDMKQLHQDLWASTNGFDFTSFGGLSWFSRVEYLLMNMAGVFDAFNPSSSEVNQVLQKTSQMEGETETRKTELEGYLDDLEGVSPTKVFSEKLESILSKFKDAFSVSQRPEWSQVYMIQGDMESFGLDLNGTMRVRAFEGIDDLDSLNTFLDFIRRFCQVVYTSASIYLLWMVFVWVWGHFVSWMKVILPFYTSIFS